MRHLSVLLVLLWAWPAAVPAQSSNAARYLLDQELEAACDGLSGAPRLNGGLFEADFDGDGRLDLMIAHEGIACGSSGRSLFCGAQVCSVKIWLRRGDLLELAHEFLGGGISVGGGPMPAISGYGHGGRPSRLSWQDGRFR